jgi:hypothetical protein
MTVLQAHCELVKNVYRRPPRDAQPLVLTPNPERKPNLPNEQKRIKKTYRAIQATQRQMTAKKCPQLEKNAQDVGSCWQSEKLGHAKGYAQALKEILSKI